MPTNSIYRAPAKQPIISHSVDALLGLSKRTKTNDVERHTGEDKDVAAPVWTP